MNPISRTLLKLVGIIAAGLGFVGIILPLVPTTPFLLLAAFCFARSSDTLYQKLLNNRWVGRYLRDYRVGRIRRRERWVTVLVMWIVIATAAYFALDAWWARLSLLVFPAGVTYYLSTLEGYDPQHLAEDPDLNHRP